MAVFLLKTFEARGYAPPTCTVATFADVPCTSNFAPWIYELVARNITAGCGGGNYCPLHQRQSWSDGHVPGQDVRSAIGRRRPMRRFLAPALRAVRRSRLRRDLHRHEHQQQRRRVAAPGDHSTPTRPRAPTRSTFNVSGAGCDGGGVCTIVPVVPLPNIGDAVTIDGYTQPGASPNTNAQGAINAVLKIVLSGASIPSSWGLYIVSDDVTIQGLVVNGFGFGVGSSSADNVILPRLLRRRRRLGRRGRPERLRHQGLPGRRNRGGRAGARRPEPDLRKHAITASSLERCTNCLVQGNLIGTDASGAAAIGAGTRRPARRRRLSRNRRPRERRGGGRYRRGPHRPG